jgi:aerobic-type carbon monoxide dehydrogenase small subunit (CoxS/CutS family)
VGVGGDSGRNDASTNQDTLMDCLGLPGSQADGCGFSFCGDWTGMLMDGDAVL